MANEKLKMFGSAIVGAGVLALGYVIYQNFNNPIDANIQGIKDKVKGLLGSKKEDCGCNKLASTENVTPTSMPNDLPPMLTESYSMTTDKDGNIDVYENDVPKMHPIPLETLSYYSASDEALNKVGGISPQVLVKSDNSSKWQ
jgi:hypothetical protein